MVLAHRTLFDVATCGLSTSTALVQQFVAFVETKASDTKEHAPIPPDAVRSSAHPRRRWWRKQLRTVNGVSQNRLISHEYYAAVSYTGTMMLRISARHDALAKILRSCCDRIKKLRQNSRTCEIGAQFTLCHSRTVENVIAIVIDSLGRGPDITSVSDFGTRRKCVCAVPYTIITVASSTFTVHPANPAMQPSGQTTRPDEPSAGTPIFLRVSRPSVSLPLPPLRLPNNIGLTLTS